MRGSAIRRRIIALLFLLVFGVWAAVAVGLATNLNAQAQQRPPAEPKVPVVVATRDLAARSRISADDIRLAEVPSSARHEDAASTLAQVAEEVVLRETFAGEPILLSTIASVDGGSRLSLRVPPDLRAIAVSFSEVIGAGGLIAPGDSVDVIAVFDERVRGRFEAGYVLTDIPVLAVARTLARADQSGALVGDDTEDLVSAKTVTLAVSPAEAARLALAERFGTLKLVVRAPGDALAPSVPPVTATDVFLSDTSPPEPGESGASADEAT